MLGEYDIRDKFSDILYKSMYFWVGYVSSFISHFMSFKMRLYTLQSTQQIENLTKNGILHGD
jgi:hypothetical protein